MRERGQTPLEVRQQALAETAKRLEAQGVAFEVVPQEVFPGMQYVTAKSLVDSGVTRYSEHHIRAMLRKGEIHGYQLGGKAILDASAVEQLLKREEGALKNPAGRKPGSPKRPGRSQQTQETDVFRSPTFDGGK